MIGETMSAPALFILIVLPAVFYSTQAQQCDQAMQDYQDCIRQNMQDSQQGQNQRPNYQEMKKKADQCFTSNNCKPPQFGQQGGRPGGQGNAPGRGGGSSSDGGDGRGGGGQGFNGRRGGRQFGSNNGGGFQNGSSSDGGDGRGGSGQGFNGRRGGRRFGSNNGGGFQNGSSSGRFGSSGSTNSDRQQCYQSVGNKTRDYMLTCIRKVDPSFNYPNKQPKTGSRQGQGKGFGDHDDGPRAGGFRGGQQYLLQACNNDTAAANKANACLAELFPNQRPVDQSAAQDRMRQNFEAYCKAKQSCQAKLGSQCQELQEKRRQATCNCGKELQSKRQEFLDQEPICANVVQQQRQRPGSGPSQGQQRDCSQKPKDYCQEGFDAMIQDAKNRRGRRHAN